MKGLAIFYKPKGWTSYDLIRFLKKKLREKKIGHGGTLDPMAEGVLVVGIKREGTKLLQEFLKESEKEYLAKIILGATSDTFDWEGKIILKQIEKYPSKDEIKKTLKEFQGKILQSPPPFSAKKIKGIPAYRLARKGILLDLPPREVEVKQIEIIDYGPFTDNSELYELSLRIVVGSGFYVRRFAFDLGEKLETGGVLKELIRTRVKNFTINEAITIQDFQKGNLELYCRLYGRVQGVGFRFFAQREAEILGIYGKAENLSDRSVEIIAQGNEKQLQCYLDKILKGPPTAQVKSSFFYFKRRQAPFRSFVIL